MVLVKVDSYVHKNELDPYISPCIQLNSKWTNDLKIKPDILNLTKRKVRNTLELKGRGEVSECDPNRAGVEANN